jgi:hypothetical protein
VMVCCSWVSRHGEKEAKVSFYRTVFDRIWLLKGLLLRGNPEKLPFVTPKVSVCGGG